MINLDQLRDRLAGTDQLRAAQIETFVEAEHVIELRAVPYDVETQLGPGVVESFAPGAFRNAAKDPSRCKLWLGHSDGARPPVGGAQLVEDRPDGVFVRARVSDTAEGRDLLTLAHDGVLDEASIEFNPLRDGMTITRRDDGVVVVRHKRAHLRGVALVAHGAYGRNALVTSVRDAHADKLRDEWLAKLRSRTA